MRITFQHTDTNQTIERQKASQRESSGMKTGTDNGYGYMLDISGSSANHEVYQEQGKTTEDVMMEAGRQNVDLTRDYMTVMSNSMSEEDFAKLQENGYQVGSTEVETAVTIVDKIKASMLEAGVSVSGYTDTLDMDTLTEITGDAGLAKQLSDAFSQEGVPLTEETAREAVEALKEAEALKEPSEDATKYMVLHDKEPVIEHYYTAQYSSAGDHGRQGRGYYQDANGYLTKMADDVNWESLQPQIERVLEEAGYSDVPGAEESARWLISAGIPLTGDTLSSYMELQKVSLPADQEALLSAMATAVSDGKSPRQANLTGAKSLWDQAYEIWDRVRNLSDAAADVAAATKGRLTLNALEAAQRLLDSGYQNVTQENAAARRQLEEVRLQMTIAANRELLKSGFSIETTELEQVIEALRDVEQNYNRILFGGGTPEETASRSQLYSETVSTVSDIPHMPLAAVGKVVSTEKRDFNLHEVKESGEALAASYKKANETYETFQTAPRADLGDSMKKAFRNVDDLLAEMGLEPTDANRRAVRILGYNHLEITEENLMTVKAADEELRNVVKKCTPAAALEMIREGKNPLTMTVAELDDYLNERQQNPEQEQEKFSKYLYKLEQKKEITQEEKESCIGIFRLLRQVEKSDGAVIGSLLNQGADLSFKNLLTFLRTGKAKGIDTVVDDQLGTLQEVRETGNRIDSQIESAFSGKEKETEYYIRLGHEAYSGLDGDKVAQIGPDEEMGLEEFTEQLRETEEDEKLNAAYIREQAEYLRTIRPEKQTVDMLHMLEEPVTPEHVQAMNEYIRDSAKAFTKIRKEADKQEGGETDRFAQSIARLEDQFNNVEEAFAAYRALTETQEQILEKAMYESEGITSLDMRELGLVYKQVSFTAKLADTEKYDIPVITEDSVMALHVEIVHSGENKGTIEASMDTEQYGKISVKLQLAEGVVKGFFIGSQEKGTEKLETIRQQAQDSLSQMGFDAENMHVGIRKNLRTGYVPGEQKQAGQPASTGTLYRAAKAVIIAIHREIERG